LWIAAVFLRPNWRKHPGTALTVLSHSAGERLLGVRRVNARFFAPGSRPGAFPTTVSVSFAN
jgi:hypothetical protein